MQQIKYASTAWNDIKNSPGWQKKVVLLALLQIVPIFGQIVLFGYIYAWARDIAWGVHSPMPDRIFGNEDGKLYSRGFFILVILFVFSLIPGIVAGVASSIVGSGVGLGLVYDSSIGFFAGTIGGLFGLVSFALSLAVLIAFNIAAMRTAIYDRISAGFQFKKLWAMFKYDTNGALRIFGMELLVSFIIALVLGLIFTILTLLCFGAAVPSLMTMGSNPEAIEVFGALGPSLSVWFLLMLAFGFFAAMCSVVVYLMVARASGYWTQQFGVAQWRGQDDPMPFELVQMQQQQQYQPYPPAGTGV